MNECLITTKEAVPASEQIALQPALAEVLTQHFHHPAVVGHVLVPRQNRAHENPVSHFKNGVPTVRGCFIRAEYSEVPSLAIEPEHVTDEFALCAGCFSLRRTRLRNFDRIIPEVWQS